MPEYLSTEREVATECLRAQMKQNFGSLFVRINKSVRNAALTECMLKLLDKNRS